MKNLIIGALGTIAAVALFVTRKKWLPKIAPIVETSKDAPKPGGGAPGAIPVQVPKPLILNVPVLTIPPLGVTPPAPTTQGQKFRFKRGGELIPPAATGFKVLFKAGDIVTGNIENTGQAFPAQVLSVLSPKGTIKTAYGIGAIYAVELYTGIDKALKPEEMVVETRASADGYTRDYLPALHPNQEGRTADEWTS